LKGDQRSADASVLISVGVAERIGDCDGWVVGGKAESNIDLELAEELVPVGRAAAWDFDGLSVF